VNEPPKVKRRGFITFQKKASRPPLTREKFLYWMDFLPKVLKVGTEFEINLPEPMQALQVKKHAPCVHSNKPCVKDCTNLETCLVDRHPTFCLTREIGRFCEANFECPAKNDTDVDACKKCPAWTLNCRGSNCARYTPFCTVCPMFHRQGDVVENGHLRMDAESIRQEMSALLQPSGCVSTVGRSGALIVKTDNSLENNNGGIEIPTVGRRVHWQSFYNMSKGIIEPVVARGGYVNERCGQHYHILAGYFKSASQLRKNRLEELEEPIPEIILANLHQLHRRYELAMFWIMSAGQEMRHLTRWAKFRQSIWKFSTLRRNMQKVQNELGDSIICMSGTNQRGKYASVAYHFCEFDSDGNVKTFHIENRIADAALSPAVVTAWAMLVYALVIKAIRLSQYGIMEAGDDKYRVTVEEILPHLIDGEKREWGAHRHADTAGITPYIPWLRENCLELINFLKPELSNLGPAYSILLSLASTPCSLRLSQGQTWEEIENSLMAEHNTLTQREGEDEVREIVDMAGIVDCDSPTAWIEEVAAYLGRPSADIASLVHQLVDSGQCRWSVPIGAIITT